MIITITGASGFVGKNITSYLSDAGILTSAVNLRSSGWRSELDLKSHAIIHLAGKAHDTSNTSGPEAYFKVNTELTIQLFNEFLESNIPDFIYFSSVKAAADTVSGILTEEVVPQPHTPYGQSKLKARRIFIKSEFAGRKAFVHYSSMYDSWPR